jgi:hypothetical protein
VCKSTSSDSRSNSRDVRRVLVGAEKHRLENPWSRAGATPRSLEPRNTLPDCVVAAADEEEEEATATTDWMGESSGCEIINEDTTSDLGVIVRVETPRRLFGKECANVVAESSLAKRVADMPGPSSSSTPSLVAADDWMATGGMREVDFN